MLLLRVGFVSAEVWDKAELDIRNFIWIGKFLAIQPFTVDSEFTCWVYKYNVRLDGEIHVNIRYLNLQKGGISVIVSWHEFEAVTSA